MSKTDKTPEAPKAGRRVRFRAYWGELVNAVIAEGSDAHWTIVRVTHKKHHFYPQGTFVRILPNQVTARS